MPPKPTRARAKPAPPEARAFAFSPRLEQVPGGGPYYVSIPARVSKAIGRRGIVPVVASVNGVAEVHASMVPCGGGRHRLRLNAATRDAADAEHKRADAKVKRIDIEIRNGASARAAERDAAAAEAAQKDARRAEAEGKLQDARRVALAAQAKVDAAQRERSDHDARFSRQSGTRNAGVDDAHGHLRAALVELGRAMLADPSLAAELGAARDEVARLEASTRKHADEVALHDTALRAYDAPQVFLGIALVALAFLILLGVVFFPLIYRSFAS